MQMRYPLLSYSSKIQCLPNKCSRSCAHRTVISLPSHSNFLARNLTYGANIARRYALGDTSVKAAANWVCLTGRADAYDAQVDLLHISHIS